MKLNLWRFIWSTVWNISERTGIGLGKFAPWVFHQMIGCDTKVNRVDERIKTKPAKCGPFIYTLVTTPNILSFLCFLTFSI